MNEFPRIVFVDDFGSLTYGWGDQAEADRRNKHLDEMSLDSTGHWNVVDDKFRAWLKEFRNELA